MNCLHHISTEDRRPLYFQRRNIYMPDSIFLVSKEGNLIEGLEKVLTIGWRICKRSIEKFENGDKKESNAFNAALCSQLNEALNLYDNVNKINGAVKVDNMDDLEMLLAKFKKFGLTTLAELTNTAEDYGIALVKLDNEQLRSELEQLKQENAQLKGQSIDQEQTTQENIIEN